MGNWGDEDQLREEVKELRRQVARYEKQKEEKLIEQISDSDFELTEELTIRTSRGEEQRYRRVKTGHWLFDPDGGNIRCGVCKAPEEWPRCFCAWCGADMRVKEDTEEC